MIQLIHTILGILLFVSHSLFLLRAVVLLRSKKTPGKADRLFLNLSQLLLPLALVSGFLMIGSASVIHVLPALMPLIMMFVLSRRSIRRKKPLLLPFLNWIFISAAFLTGVLL
ncbi:MAG: hypothetical protein PQJ58_04380 [Spirochaetales bacterium]|nr:hypothetical protein [Spirochaetales bacterium]